MADLAKLHGVGSEPANRRSFGGWEVLPAAAKISEHRSSVSPSTMATNFPVGSCGVPAVTGGAALVDCDCDPPLSTCAPFKSAIGSIPKYQLMRPIMMPVPMPRPPVPPG